MGLNSHNWVKWQLSFRKLNFTTRGSCFHIKDACETIFKRDLSKNLNFISSKQIGASFFICFTWTIRKQESIFFKIGCNEKNIRMCTGKYYNIERWWVIRKMELDFSISVLYRVKRFDGKIFASSKKETSFLPATDYCTMEVTLLFQLRFCTIITMQHLASHLHQIVISVFFIRKTAQLYFHSTKFNILDLFIFNIYKYTKHI